ncbi:MAG: hypothetical protein OER21_02995 [Gemmatimonadota bacterium]|nr:hypothetical protein [Gemmatimonadota bacterium]
MRIHAGALVLVVVACGGERSDQPAVVTSDDSIEAAIAAASDTTLPPMPALPGRRGGQMTVRAVGVLDFEKTWPARAGRCARPAMILVVAEEPGSGGSVLLQLPDSGPLTGGYPVKIADSTGVPAAPAAQLGFQFFQERSSDAYQAAEGSVEVYSLDDLRVSGQFTATVRHIVNERRARVAGVFHGVDVEALPPDWCEQAQAAQDSLRKQSP